MIYIQIYFHKHTLNMSLLIVLYYFIFVQKTSFVTNFRLICKNHGTRRTETPMSARIQYIVELRLRTLLRVHSVQDYFTDATEQYQKLNPLVHS